MQSVSSDLLTILRRSYRDLVTVVELYNYDAVPGASGYDPQSADLVECFANVSGITFRTRTYLRMLTRIGDVKRTITREHNNFTFTLSNIHLNRYAAQIHLTTGYEGLICVVRILSRSASTDLDDSIVLFTGRCEKPDSFDRSSESVSITAKQIVGSTELNMPRRRFTPDDEEGRHPNDVLFEGFRFSVQYGTTQYSARERRGGLLGLIGFKKNVTKTLQFSSHSDLDAEKSVPVVFGRVQLVGHHVAYIDLGVAIRTTTVFCEGQIKEFINPRVVTPGFYFGFPVHKLYGTLGGVGDQIPNGLADWPGNGYYSRTALLFTDCRGTTAQQDDPAPDIVALIRGLIITVPDETGDFVLTDWTDNPVYIARHILTSDEFLKLGSDFVDDEITYESGRYCDQILIDQSGSDGIYLPDSESTEAGTNYELYRPTSTITPEWFKVNAGTASEAEESAAFTQENDYEFFADEPPIEPVDRGPGFGTGNNLSLSSFTLRRRYTANVVATDQQKITDFLFNILFPAARMYLTTTAQGKIGIRVAKPADNTILRTSSIVGATSCAVFDVDPWRDSLSGKILIGANLTTSEIRTVTAAKFTTASNSITLAGTNLTVSGATLSGADNNNNTATGTMTVPDLDDTKTLTIDGYEISYVAIGSDTVDTVAGFFWAAVNGHTVLQKYVKATWDGDDTITIISKLGTLDLDSALENAHAASIASPTVAPTVAAGAGGDLGAGDWNVSYAYETASGETLPSPQTTTTVTSGQKLTVTGITPPAGVTAVNWYASVAGGTTMRLRRVLQNSGAGFEITEAPSRNNRIEPNYNSTGEELLRVAFAFSDQAETQANLTRANMLKGSFKWPMGSNQPSVNRVIVKFRDATQDFKLTELRVKDSEHITRVKKILDKEVNGAAIDNFHQAHRIANGNLAEAREGDFFTALASDGEALLLDEGDVIAVTDSSGGFVNLPVRVEEVTIKVSSGNPEIQLFCKKYSKAFYDDEVAEKILSIPTRLGLPRMGSPEQTAIVTGDSTIYSRFTLVDSASPSTQTLDSSIARDGDEYTVKNIGTGLVTVEATTGNIDGAASELLYQYDSRVFRFDADSGDWLII